MAVNNPYMCCRTDGIQQNSVSNGICLRKENSMKTRKPLCFLIAVLLLAAVLPVFPASATWEKPELTFTEGESYNETIFKVDSGDGIKSWEPFDCGVPGMGCYVGPTSMSIKGTPTKAGSYLFQLNYETDGGGNGTITYFVTVKAATKSYFTDIYVYQKPDKLTYKVGENLKTAGMEIRAKHTVYADLILDDGDYNCSPDKFTAAGTQKVTVSAKLNGKNGTETFTTSFQVTVNEAKPTEKPKITKDPTGEDVLVGDSCSFIARADGANTITWYLVSPGGNEIPAKKGPDSHKGLKVSGSTEEKLKLSHIPESMDGWKVYASFENEIGATASKKATVTVNSVSTPKPTEKQSGTTTPKPTEKPETTPEPTEAPSPTPHIHQFDESSWQADENTHFHVCTECGSKEGFGEPHDFTWTVTQKATRKQEGIQTGTCSICGFITTMPLVYGGSETSSVLIILFILLIILVLALIGIGILLLRKRRR